jgi:hypothetical protein
MTFIGRLFTSVPITTKPEAQPEATPPPQTEAHFGIAESTDSFENAALNSFELQQPQEVSAFKPPATIEATIDAASMFLDVTVPQQPDRIGELSQRLKMLKTQKEELVTQLRGTEEKKSSSIKRRMQ